MLGPQWSRGEHVHMTDDCETTNLWGDYFDRYLA
jgi:hypothetical protein